MHSGEKFKSTVEKVQKAKWRKVMMDIRKKLKCTIGKKKTAIIRLERTFENAQWRKVKTHSGEKSKCTVEKSRLGKKKTAVIRFEKTNAFFPPAARYFSRPGQKLRGRRR